MKKINSFVGAMFSLISFAHPLNFKTSAFLSTTGLMISSPQNLKADEDFIKANKLIERLTKLIENDPYNEKYYSFRASTKLKIKDYNGAIADYRKVLEINPKK